jgi:hypothetical protein
VTGALTDGVFAQPAVAALEQACAVSEGGPQRVLRPRRRTHRSPGACESRPCGASRLRLTELLQVGRASSAQAPLPASERNRLSTRPGFSRGAGSRGTSSSSQSRSSPGSPPGRLP